MTQDPVPRPIITADDLSKASIADVLLYGLTLDDDDPALGVLVGVRQEIGIITSLAEQSKHHPDFDLGELMPVLERMGRRLDVAIELFTRAYRAAESEAPAAPDPPAAPRGATPP